MNEGADQNSERGDSAVGGTPPLPGDWKETLRRVHLNCAAQWAASAEYWRGVAARYVVAENWVMASEALFNATIREEYAAADLAKAGVGNIEHRTPGGAQSNAERRSPEGSVLRTAADGDVGAPGGKHSLN